jgi:hypothetical protein
LQHFIVHAKAGAASAALICAPVERAWVDQIESTRFLLITSELASWGWTAIIPGFGVLADEFPEPALKTWKLVDGRAEFAPGIRIPLEPFCSEIGLAPSAPGALSTIPSYRHGGNMDTKHLTKGTTLYLPIEAPSHPAPTRPPILRWMASRLIGWRQHARRFAI